ncbi:MAG: hypothetical protein ACE5IZ_05645 [Dehalococcoidia bacterium]
MAADRPQVGQIHIVDGSPYPEGPCAGLFTARSLGKATLYVVVEPTTPASDALSGQVVGAVGSHFRRQNLSLTGALLQSLQAAHQELLAGNRLSLRQQQTGIGVTCLALRRGEAYMAQAGPTLAYVRAGGGIRRLVPEDSAQPLGLAEELRPSFTRYLLTGGDAVLLTFTALASRNDEAVAAALASPVDEALRRIYALVSDLPRFAALLVALPMAFTGAADE